MNASRRSLAIRIALLALLHVRCELDAAVWVKVRPPLPLPPPRARPHLIPPPPLLPPQSLWILERCVRRGVPIDASTVRPLVLACTLIASKEHYDEAMRVVRRPPLTRCPRPAIRQLSLITVTEGESDEPMEVLKDGSCVPVLTVAQEEEAAAAAAAASS